MGEHEQRETVELDGHQVDAHSIDMFFDGDTGRRVTDEEWDESKRRLQEHELADAIEQQVVEP